MLWAHRLIGPFKAPRLLSHQWQKDHLRPELVCTQIVLEQIMAELCIEARHHVRQYRASELATLAQSPLHRNPLALTGTF